MPATSVSPHAPTTLLVLYSDRADPVVEIVRAHAARFGMDLIAMSVSQLVDEVIVGPTWTWSGRVIDPAMTAVVNRIGSVDGNEAEGPFKSAFQRRRFWGWLHDALRQFAYVSSLPSAIAPDGGFGSLLDQWSDLPQLIPGLNVPAHRTPWGGGELQGDICIVNPWHLYSLGTRVPAVPADIPRDQLAYVRPAGMIVHVAQVGSHMIAVNAPPTVTRAQQDYVVSFTRTMDRVSDSRILEHAFFIGHALPVFYSTCTVPVITGRLPEFATIVVQGLLDDIHRRRRRAAQ